MSDDSATNGALNGHDPLSRPSIGQHVHTFVENAKSLISSLLLTMSALQSAHRQESEEWEGLRQEYRVEDEADGDTEVFRIPIARYEAFNNKSTQVSRLARAHMLVPRSFLVSLISQYDAFLGSLISAVFLIRPEILRASERNLTFAQLVRFDSIELARDYVIEKEVETVLRQSHADHFNWMESRFAVPLRKGLDVWPDFIEVTQRRNLFVHTGGKVSSQYLKVCEDQGVDLDPELDVGDELDVSPDYFRHAYSVIFEIAVKLGHVLWRKHKPEEREKADVNLNTIAYDLLYEGDYFLAQRILDFATVTLKKHSSEDVRLYLVVNRAQAYKWQNDEERAREILNDEDWSATADRFKLAHAVLLDDFDRATEIVRRIGDTDRVVNEHAYRCWPLFREFRKTERFSSAFEEIFGRPLETVDVPSIDRPASSERPPNDVDS